MTNLENFKKLGLSANTLEAIAKKGFEEPSPIQEKTIPLLLNSNKDIVAQAQTGTGKTASFGLPIIEKLSPDKKIIQALILTPTRELTIQVVEELNSLKGAKKLKILPIYGGQSIEKQIRDLKKNIDIIVGTPGRIIDHLKHKRIKLNNLSYLILDEADEMLNIGFKEELETILAHTNNDKQTLLFSATMPNHILELAKKYMHTYEIIRTKTQQLTTNLTEQIYFEVRESDKLEALCRIIDIEQEFYGLIFCRTKRDVDNVSEKLLERGYDVEGLHGDLSQHQRERIMDKFKKQWCQILVATDVAARGIDVTNLTHVINYALPQDPASYIHRIGRTGRAGQTGTAITFVTPSEYRKLTFIEKKAKTEIRKKPIPSIQSIIKNKKNRIQANIQKQIQSEIETEYLNMAKSLLENTSPTIALASLLKITYQKELNQNNYQEIKDISIDKKGTARLFVAKGKLDHMTPKKLVMYIEQQSHVYGKKIQEVKVYEKFSFITVSFQDAEKIIKAFKPKNPNKRSIIEHAKK